MVDETDDIDEMEHMMLLDVVDDDEETAVITVCDEHGDEMGEMVY